MSTKSTRSTRSTKSTKSANYREKDEYDSIRNNSEKKARDIEENILYPININYKKKIYTINLSKYDMLKKTIFDKLKKDGIIKKKSNENDYNFIDENNTNIEIKKASVLADIEEYSLKDLETGKITLTIHKKNLFSRFFSGGLTKKHNKKTSRKTRGIKK
jgi:hypothetical protein